METVDDQLDAEIEHVRNLMALGTRLLTWNHEGKINFHAETSFEWLNMRIGRSWEKPENLKALVGPHGWAVFKALEAQYLADQSTNTDRAP